ncbi:hypothetical protein EDI_105260 [Entamoeba dispar SAW760]|uniref:Uncharacterized protein n=1 Tax=Entamoeba dispar (strain ATCC PRA-260 / SAW760) TaxID=370354 RepID=B0E7V4_ENTDS|nr:uncharacterized protein EDI_105260 [Entamoeba dispar SAW760]EDR29391.1 hypothetical protein EDI_105260 [Entamoeba dispar SAW760]|eukprot:EDR29391.1 hypothetical protein EDI_105260 [Entamoeba dispar SAW760]
MIGGGVSSSLPFLIYHKLFYYHCSSLDQFLQLNNKHLPLPIPLVFCCLFLLQDITSSDFFFFSTKCFLFNHFHLSDFYPHHLLFTLSFLVYSIITYLSSLFYLNSHDSIHSLLFLCSSSVPLLFFSFLFNI